MTEYNIGYLAVANLIALSVASLLYMAGGRAVKGLRRFGASFVIAAQINITAAILGAWSAWLLLIYPFKIGEMSLGYGGHSMPRAFQRILITLISCLSGLIFCLIFNGITWWLLGLQLLVGIGTVMFAFKNPIYAAVEEPLVCMLNNTVLIFYPFIIK